MSLIDKAKKRMESRKTETKEQTRRSWQEFYDHPLLFTALIVSGFLSGLAGLAIGFGVHVENGFVTYQADLPHIFFALLFAALFPYFFEFGLANWLHKMLHREPSNRTQEWTSYVMVGLTFIGTAITAFSAMDVLVTSLGFFPVFQEIPPQVQGWIAMSIPGMVMLNIAAGELYRQSSESSTLRREIEKDLREAQITADNEVRLAQMEAERDIAVHAATEYANRAMNESQQIGANKGGQQWNKDREKHGQQSQQQLRPAMASEAETVKLSDSGQKSANPPSRPPQS
jgi:hypothetical protein